MKIKNDITNIKKKGKIIILLLLILCFKAISQNTYYVRTTGNDANNGISWDNAFSTIQKAVATATTQDEIRIGKGLFHVNTQIIIENKSLAIKGSYTSSDTQDYSDKTIFDGQEISRIFQIKGTTSSIPQVSIDGFIFRNANSPGYSGAVVFDKASGIVTNCEFVNNASRNYGGGGLAFLGTGTQNKIINCSFFENTGKEGGAIFSGSGTTLDIINSTIANNLGTDGNSIFSTGIVNLSNSIIWGVKTEDNSGESIISQNFVGIGTQLGGYDTLNDLIQSHTLSDSDWQQIFSRLQFMRPGLVRFMGSRGWNYSINGQYNPSKSQHILFKMLDFCQAQNINVIWGEWGHTGGTSVDMAWLDQSINFLDYLVNTKGYTCIKYFTMLNEPQGTWSSNGGSYPLWKDLIIKTRQVMRNKGLLSKVSILAPDVSIGRAEFDNNSVGSFITNTINDVDSIIGSYCYHLYPTPERVQAGKMLSKMTVHKNILPPNKDALITEIGYVYDTYTTKGQINEALKAADPYAAGNANMMVYESSYGVDIAAAIIQLMNIGYKAAVVWRLDDIMYTTSVAANNIQLTRWGFWNSLGTEKFNNPDDEKLRPWFYTMSLLSRFFPTGSTILNVNIPVQSGLYAIAGRKNGKYTIAIVNMSANNHSFDLTMPGGKSFTMMKHYQFDALTGSNFTGQTDANGFAVPFKTDDVELSAGNSYPISMGPNSFMMMTNME